MAKKKIIVSTPKGGLVSRDNQYARISRLYPKALRVLNDLLDSKNPSVALGAVNKVVDKTIPDPVADKQGTNIQINVMPFVNPKWNAE